MLSPERTFTLADIEGELEFYKPPAGSMALLRMSESLNDPDFLKSISEMWRSRFPDVQLVILAADHEFGHLPPERAAILREAFERACPGFL